MLSGDFREPQIANLQDDGAAHAITEAGENPSSNDWSSRRPFFQSELLPKGQVRPMAAAHGGSGLSVRSASPCAVMNVA
jgi:hypothetical protein